MNIINIEHIHKIFGDKVIFDDVSCGIQEGDKIGIIGINGTGKSTLLKMIAGEEETDEGQIVRQNGLRIAYMPQNPDIPKGATVTSYALDGNPDTDWQVMSNLTKLGIMDYEAVMDHMSGGQRRRVAMAKVLAGDFDVLNLDEGVVLALCLTIWIRYSRLRHTRTLFRFPSFTATARSRERYFRASTELEE